MRPCAFVTCTVSPVNGEQFSMIRHLFCKSLPPHPLTLTSYNVATQQIGDSLSMLRQQLPSMLLGLAHSVGEVLLGALCSLNYLVRTACRMLQSNFQISNNSPGGLCSLHSGTSNFTQLQLKPGLVKIESIRLLGVSFAGLDSEALPTLPVLLRETYLTPWSFCREDTNVL